MIEITERRFRRVFLSGTETMERRPIDWRILGGGIVFGVVVVVLGAGGIPLAQEIIFIISMAVVCYMLVLVTAELDHNTRMGILFATIIVFAFRAAPTVGDGYFWWTLDELNFDATFYGTLRQTGAIMSIAVGLEITISRPISNLTEPSEAGRRHAVCPRQARRAAPVQ